MNKVDIHSSLNGGPEDEIPFLGPQMDDYPKAYWSEWADKIIQTIQTRKAPGQRKKWHGACLIAVIMIGLVPVG